MKRYLGTLGLILVAVAPVCAFAQKNPAPKVPHPAAQKSATVKIWGIVRHRATNAGAGRSPNRHQRFRLRHRQCHGRPVGHLYDELHHKQLRQPATRVTLTARQTGLDFSPKTAYMSLANDARRDVSGCPAAPAQKSGKK